MRDAGGQLPERRQLLARDDLVLGPLQLGQHALQLIVLALQLLRELFHQVEALHLVGVATEHLQRRGHVGDLVLADDLDRRLDIAFRHAPHAVGQLRETTQQHAPDVEPGDEQRAAHADAADGEQQRAPRPDRLAGRLRGLAGARARRAHQVIDFVDEVDDDDPVEPQQRLLALPQPQFLLEQVEAAIVVEAGGEHLR